MIDIFKNGYIVIGYDNGVFALLNSGEYRKIQMAKRKFEIPAQTGQGERLLFSRAPIRIYDSHLKKGVETIFRNA